MPEKDIVKKTGWVVKSILSHCFNPEVGDPWKKDDKGHRIRVTKDEIREINKMVRDIPESEFNDIIEGLKDSLFATLHHRGHKDQFEISFTGLPWCRELE